MLRLTDQLCFRLLRAEDHRDYLALLDQLTQCPPLAFEQFSELLVEVQRDAALIVAEERGTGRLVATCKLLFERKFARSGALLAHLEDVVVDAASRGAGVGRQLLSVAEVLAKRRGCYKIVGYCTPALSPFYASEGFAADNAAFAKYLDPAA